MKLLFQNSRGKLRTIAKIDGRKPDKDIYKLAAEEIQRFCDERNFKIYYSRIWNEDRNGKLMTKFDVGSHTEFFYLEKALNIGEVLGGTE